MIDIKLAHIDPAKDPFHDFRNFAFYVMTNVLKLGDTHDIQYDICNWMQDMTPQSDGLVRKQIQAMRTCGKSVMACIFICWLWYCNPTIRVMILCSVAKKSNEMAGLIKQILDGCDLVQHLRPDPDSMVTYRRGKKIRDLKKAKNSEDAFDIQGAGPGKDPSFAAYPLFGGWTGSHPDVIIPDDVEIPENSMTALWRDRIFEKLRECESLVMEGGMIMYMGTPQTEESVYNRLEAIGYPIRRWPAEHVDPKDEVRCLNVSPLLLDMVRNGEAKPGDPTYPERLPRERLVEKKAKGLAYYNLQFLLDTTLSDQERYPLKLKDLIVFDTPRDMAPTNIVWGTANRITHIDHAGLRGDHLHGPGYVEDEWLPFQQKVMYIDPKGGGADSVGWAVGGFLNGVIYCIDAGGMAAGQDGTSEVVMKKLAHLAFTYDIKRIVVESNWGGGKEVSAYAKLLQPVVSKVCGPTAVETAFVKGQKEVRIIDTMKPLMEAHRFVLSERAAKCKELLYQLTHITADRGALGHDDELDAVQGMVAQFIENVNLDPEVREEQRRHSAAVALAEDWDRETSRKSARLTTKQRRQSNNGLRNQRGRWKSL